jgi:hypothetical protein
MDSKFRISELVFGIEGISIGISELVALNARLSFGRIKDSIKEPFLDEKYELTTGNYQLIEWYTTTRN